MKSKPLGHCCGDSDDEELEAEVIRLRALLAVKDATLRLVRNFCVSQIKNHVGAEAHAKNFVLPIIEKVLEAK